MNHYKSIILTSLVLLPVLAYAELGPIIVTGTKTEQLLSESAVPVEIITSEQIRNSVATDVADIIEMYSGLEIARNGDYGKTTSLFIRGTNSNHALILVDGVKINPGTLGQAALQNISPDIIERIEIVKGPRSSLYGSEAIGGVVNIITRKAVKGRNAKITVGAGENGTDKVGFSGFYGNGNLSSGLTIEQFDVDGFPVQDASAEDHGFENGTINAFFDYQMNRSDIRLSHWSAKGNVEYFLAGFPPFTSDQELDQDFKNSSTALAWEFAISSDIKSTLRISSITDDIQQNQSADYATTERKETELQFDFTAGIGSTLSLGFLSAREDVDALYSTTNILESNEIDATFIQYQASRARYNYAIAFRNIDHDKFGNHDTWNLDYQFSISDESKLYFGSGTAFRAPNTGERFVGWGGNPDLEPEKSRSLEFGWKYKSANIDNLQISIFKTSIEDMIGYDEFNQAGNIDEVEISGIEMDYRAGKNEWGYGINLLVQDPIDKSDGSTLLRRAKKRANIDIHYKKGLLKAGGALSIVGKRNDIGSVTLDSYQLVNVFVRYQLAKSAELSAKIENLFDEDYETASGFNTKGQTAFLEFSYSFEG